MVQARTDKIHQDEPDWRRLTNHLAGRAIEKRVPLPTSEIYSLAGLAVAISRTRYDPEQATAGLGAWVCTRGWLQLCTLIRDEMERRSHDEQIALFTDLPGGRPSPEQADEARYILQCALACPSGPRTAPDWYERLSHQDRRIVWMRAAGCTLREVALVHARTKGWVRWRLKRLRSEVAGQAGRRRRARSGVPAPRTNRAQGRPR